MQSIILYISIIIAIALAFLLVSHYIAYSRISTAELRILQSEHPMPDVIESMMNQKLPIIFLYELELWDGVDEIIGHTSTDIAEVMKDNTVLINNIKKIYLKPYTLPLTKEWIINLKTQTDVWDKLPAKPIQQTSYNYLLANLTGLMMVCLISPKHRDIIEKQATDSDFKQTLSTPDAGLDYITIPIRPSNMLSIPYGWYYYIYCGQANSYCSYLEMTNKTWFN
jgi:hypothetical protein